MKQPIKITSDYDFTYEIFENKIVLKNSKGKIVTQFIDDCEYLEQAIFIYRKMRDTKEVKP
jgi:hypothetical protein